MMFWNKPDFSSLRRWVSDMPCRLRNISISILLKIAWVQNAKMHCMYFISVTLYTCYCIAFCATSFCFFSEDQGNRRCFSASLLDHERQVEGK